MATPSKKSSEMEETLKILLGVDRRHSIEHNICIVPPIGCGGPAEEFRDELSRKEYTISGLCQECQDDVFRAEADG